MKKQVLWFAVIAAVCLAGCPSPTTSEEEKKAAVEEEFGIKGDGVIALIVEETRQLEAWGTATLVESAAWTSSDASKASVSAQGLVTALAKGAVVITATSGTKSATVTVTVEPKPTKPVSINGEKARMIGVGSTSAIQLTLSGDAVQGGSVTWISHDTPVATVSGGKVEGKANGSTTITVQVSKDGQTEVDSVSVVVSAAQTTPNDPVEISGLEALGFKTDENNTLAYALTNGGIEIRANPDAKKDGISDWLLTAFYRDGRNTRGWYYDLNGRGIRQSGGTNSPTWDDTGYNLATNPDAVPRFMLNGVQRDEENGVELRLNPMLITVGGVPYVLLVHTLTNTSDTPVTGQKFGVYSDVMLGGYGIGNNSGGYDYGKDGNDKAPIEILNGGNGNLVMKDNDYQIELICKEGEPVTPVNTLWIGQPNAGGRYGWQRVYEDHTATSMSGSDSAFAFSYQGIDLVAGESKIFMVRFTLTKAAPAESEQD